MDGVHVIHNFQNLITPMAELRLIARLSCAIFFISSPDKIAIVNSVKPQKDSMEIGKKKTLQSTIQLCLPILGGIFWFAKGLSFPTTVGKLTQFTWFVSSNMGLQTLNSLSLGKSSLEPQTTIYKRLFQLDNSQSLHRKWLFHQTSIF